MGASWRKGQTRTSQQKGKPPGLRPAFHSTHPSICPPARGTSEIRKRVREAGAPESHTGQEERAKAFGSPWITRPTPPPACWWASPMLKEEADGPGRGPSGHAHSKVTVPLGVPATSGVVGLPKAVCPHFLWPCRSPKLKGPLARRKAHRTPEWPGAFLSTMRGEASLQVSQQFSNKRPTRGVRLRA